MEKGHKVLIAEDEQVTQRLLERSFEGDSRFEIKLVGDGEEALQEYKAWQPDILLLDIIMPKVNGYRVLYCLRKQFNDRKVCVIMMSSITDKQEITVCAKLGIQGYIVKPIKTHELSDIVFSYYQNA